KPVTLQGISGSCPAGLGSPTNYLLDAGGGEVTSAVSGGSAAVQFSAPGEYSVSYTFDCTDGQFVATSPASPPLTITVEAPPNPNNEASGGNNANGGNNGNNGNDNGGNND